MGAMAALDIDIQELVSEFTQEDAHYLLTLPAESDDAATYRGELFDRLDAKGWVPPTLSAIAAQAIRDGDLPRALELLTGGTNRAVPDTQAS